MKVFITGIGGWIGARLADTLIDRGHEVAGVDLRLGHRLPHPKAVVVAGDVREPSAWRHLLEDADAIVHSAAVHHVDRVLAHPAQAIDINLRGTRTVLEAAVDARARGFMFLSSAKVYGDAQCRPSMETDLVSPVEPYGLSKAVCEQYVRHFATEHGLCTSVLRPFSVYGPDQDLDTGYIGTLLQSAARHSRAVLEGERTFRRDFVHIDDVVAALVALLEDEGEPPDVVNVASGTSLGLAEAAAMLERLSEVPLQLEFTTPRPGTIAATHGDITRLSDLLGRDPIGLEAGLVSTLDWFMAASSRRD
jgi:UDP-glucose 4-epimerase